MEVEHVTLLFEETAEDAAARLARGTANARANIEDVTRAVEGVRSAFIEDVKSAVHSCVDDIQESLEDGRVTYTGMRHEEVVDEDDDEEIAPASQIEMHFEVELEALPFDYRPKDVIIIDREDESTCVLRLMTRGVFRSMGTSNVTMMTDTQQQQQQQS